MTDERYKELSESYTLPLTQDEIEQGWHFCLNWDGMLVGPEMPELEACTCQPKNS